MDFSKQQLNLSASDKWLLIAVITLSLPAFFINLAEVPIIGDEGIRMLVALEMKLSGNYIVPTLNGEYYFNKPPLYNWFLVVSSEIFGEYNEWPARITTLFFLACFAITVYCFFKEKLDSNLSFAMALLLITSGRILFWDSMLALIDICFSWLIFMNFMLWYFLPRKEKWIKVFIISYIIIAAAFMLKGLPAIVFQGITIIVALIFHNNFKTKILSAGHFLGLATFLLLCGIYYFIYFQYVSPVSVLSTLTEQSLMRTGISHGIWKTIIHLFTFPFEQLYHFLPWSLLIIAVFHPEFIRIVRNNDFIYYCLIIMISNLIVYWTSVEVYPRYLLMFIPLFNIVMVYILFFQDSISAKLQTCFLIIIKTMVILTALCFLIFPYIERSRQVDYWYLIWIIGFSLSWLIYAGLKKFPEKILIWGGLSLLLFRIGFSALVLPFRAEDYITYHTRIDSKRLAEKYNRADWYIYDESELHNVARFYISKYKGQIIRKTDNTNLKNSLYLVDPCLYPDFEGEKLDSIRLENGEFVLLMNKK